MSQEEIQRQARALRDQERYQEQIAAFAFGERESMCRRPNLTSGLPQSHLEA